MAVIIYTTTPCVYCSRAKAVLDKLGISYQEKNLARDNEGRAQLVEKTGLMTFPQIIVNYQVLGGYDQLQDAVATGYLDKLLDR